MMKIQACRADDIPGCCFSLSHRKCLKMTVNTQADITYNHPFYVFPQTGIHAPRLFLTLQETKYSGEYRYNT